MLNSGMLPGTHLFVWPGSAAQDIMQAIKGSDDALGAKFYLTSFLIVFSVLGLFYLFNRKLKQWQ